MGLTRAVEVSVMGPRRIASVLRRGMRLLTRLVPVRADREILGLTSSSIEDSKFWFFVFAPHWWRAWLPLYWQDALSMRRCIRD